MTKTNVDYLIKKYARDLSEKEELWGVVSEIVHHRVVCLILDNLDREHHEEFLVKLDEYDFGDEIIAYLEIKSGKEITAKIKNEVELLEKEILQELEIT